MRSIRAASALVLVLASWPAHPQGSTIPDVDLDADRISYDWEARTLTLEGHVVVMRAGATLRAARGVLDRKKDLLTLSGGVIGIQGRQVFVAEEAVVDLAARSAELKSAMLFVKQSPPDQFPATSAAARAMGKNALILTGKRVRRLESGALIAEGVTLTPCDCAGEPDYELSSPEARVEGDRARLSSPSLHVLGASIPLLVPVSLPLTDRQSGLLFPPFGYAQVTGFGTELPLFLTMGRSADATLAAGLFTGSGGASGPELGRRSVSGPRFGMQFRYAPVEGTRGEITADLVKDLRAKDSPAVSSTFPGEEGTSAGRGFDGVRGTVRFGHRTEVGSWLAAAQGTVATDGMVVPDTQPVQLDRYLDALPTHLGVVRAAGPVSVGADGTLLQDVRIPNAAVPDRRLFGPERRATFQRLPSAFLQLAPVRIGPLALSTEASVTRFAPFGRIDPQERATGFGPTDLGHAAEQSVDDPFGLARGRTIRFDAAPRLTWSTQSLPVVLEADAGGRADAWLFDGDPGRDQRRAYGTGGVRASTTLSRPIGGLLHAVTPQIEVRGVTPAARSGSSQRIGDPNDAGGAVFCADPSAAQQGVATDLPLRARSGCASAAGSTTVGVPAARRPYDEIDGAAPSEGEALARLSVAQALWARGGAGRAPARVARLELSQDAVLWDGAGRARLGEAGALGQLSLGPFAASGRVQLDWGLRAVTLLEMGANARTSRGDELHASTLLLRGVASGRQRAGVDELFAAARVAADAGALIGSAQFGGSVALPVGRQGLKLGYDGWHFLGALPADTADWLHRLGLLYDTPCRCAAIQVAATLPFRGGTILRGPSLTLLIDLKSLGSFGTP